MVMDKKFGVYSGQPSGVGSNDHAVPVFLDPDLINKLSVGDNGFDENRINGIPVSGHLSFSPQVPSSSADSPEDLDFSDAVLKYINHILLEQDVEDKSCMFQESAALQAAEKSFYDVIGERYPGPVDLNSDYSFQNPGGNSVGVSNEDCGSCPEFNSNRTNVVSQSSYSSSSSSGTKFDGPIDSSVSSLRISDIFSDSESAVQFKKGVEEASKFLQTSSNLLFDFRHDGRVQQDLKIDYEKFTDVSRGKKNRHRESTDLQEERSNKQSAVYTETTVPAETFDAVLLCSGGKNDSALRRELDEVSKSSSQNVEKKGSNGVKSRGKKKGGKRNVVDLRTLLTLCAQAVAADDRRTANEFLKQIRQHATPTGDGMQRLAHYFAHGLEARMAGSGTEIYKSLINIPTSAADILKAYHIYLATCPFRKISNFFSNRTILNVTEKATAVHIIDFGILYGFQWPNFLMRLSSRPGGPPKVRVTGIDFPCPGFRPSQRVKETGRRLTSYAQTFKVPFEFTAIAQKWETIKLEDLKIDRNEMLVVNCLYRFRNLLDETVVVNSPRNIVLNLIRKINPAVFVMGIMNGAYNAPFFVTRFREALFHYSSFFDMLDANIPREIHERMLLEKTVFGREAMNVIACEAAERIERPETYKQWQVRNLRAGFEQLPLDPAIVNAAKNRVKSTYHKDFVIDEDGRWLLQGWKGRIVYALSTWKATY